MTRRLPVEVGDRVRTMLRDGRYAEAAEYAAKALAALGLDPSRPEDVATAPKRLAKAAPFPGKPDVPGRTGDTVGGRMGEIFEKEER